MYLVLVVYRKPTHVQLHVAEAAAQGYKLSMHFLLAELSVNCLLRSLFVFWCMRNLSLWPFKKQKGD